jgi:small subunit ribosomal protein S21
MKPNSSKHHHNSRSTFTGQKGGDRRPVEVVIDKHQPIQAKPLEVRIGPGDNFEKCLRAFRAKVQKERILSTYNERASYEKPSDKKRRKINEAKRQQLEFCSKGECDHPEHASNRRER